MFVILTAIISSTGNGEVIGSNPMGRPYMTLIVTILHAPFLHVWCRGSTFNLLGGSGSNPDIKSVMNYLKTKNIKQNTRKRSNR